MVIILFERKPHLKKLSHQKIAKIETVIRIFNLNEKYQNCSQELTLILFINSDADLFERKQRS